jgi:tetratricopeptide (TPR) repeat protein
MKWVLLACSPIPGLVQFMTSRPRQGLLLVIAGAVGLNGVLILGPQIRPEGASTAVLVISWIVLLGAGSISVVDTIRHVILLDRAKLTRDKRRLLDRGIECYLKGNAEDAAMYFTQMSHMDPQDADARVYLASSLKARGDAAGARRNFKRAAALNSAKWSWEVAVALKELEEK